MVAISGAELNWLAYLPILGFFPALGPLIGIAGGLLGKAFGGSGRQGGQNQATTQNVTGSTTGTVSGAGRNVSERFEDPLLAPFREQFLGSLGQELQRVQQPIYGEGQQAGFLNQLNDLTNNAQTAITNRFAATGGARSGTAEDQLTQSELFRGGQAANFFSQLPFLEEQARRQSTAGLLGQGLNFVGRGVTNEVNTNEANQTSTQESQQQSQGTLDQNVEGPGFFKNLAGAGAGFLGELLGRNPTDPFSIFRRGGAPSDIQTSEIPLQNNQRGSLDLLDPSRSVSFGTPPFRAY